MMKKWLSFLILPAYMTILLMFNLASITAQTTPTSDLLNIGFETEDWATGLASNENVKISTEKALTGTKSFRLAEVAGRQIVEYKATAPLTNAFVEYALYDDLSANRVIAKIEETSSTYVMLGVGTGGKSDDQYEFRNGNQVVKLAKRVAGWHKFTVFFGPELAEVYLDGQRAAIGGTMKVTRVVAGLPWVPDWVPSTGLYMDDVRIGTGRPSISTVGLTPATIVDKTNPQDTKTSSGPSASKTTWATHSVVNNSAYDQALVLRVDSNEALVKNQLRLIDARNPALKTTLQQGQVWLPVSIVASLLGLDPVTLGEGKPLVEARRLASMTSWQVNTVLDQGLVILSPTKLQPSTAEVTLLSSQLRTISAKTAVVYVSPAGQDTASGSLTAPLKTLEAARAKVETLSKAGQTSEGAVVYVQSGTYDLRNSLNLTARDSGKPGAVIRYVGYGEEKPTLSAGINVPTSAFLPLSDAQKGRFQAEARDKIKVADLATLGLTSKDLAGLVYQGHGIKNLPSQSQVFVDGTVLQVARWPNQGYVTIASVIEKGVSYDPFGPGAKFSYLDPSQRAKTWAANSDIWISGYLGNDYADTTVKLTQLDTETRLIKTEYPGNYPIVTGQRFFFLNVPEELDAEGEYYLDTATTKLYVFTSKLSAKSSVWLTLSDKPVLNLDGVSQVSFENLNLAYGRGVGVNVNQSKDLALLGCDIQGFGLKAIVAANEADDLYDIQAAERGVRNFRIAGNNIFNIGKGGILISGGDRKLLVPGGIVIENNDLHDYAQLRADDGIKVLGVGNRIASNKIHSAPKKAIHFQGNDMVVEYNEIFDVCLQVNDMGAVYMGRDLTMQGNVIRYNFFHDIVGRQGMDGVHAIYCDDFSNGIQAYGNLIYKVQDPIKFNGGSDHRVYNNIVAEQVAGSKFWLEINDFSNTLGAATKFPETHKITENVNRVPYQSSVWTQKYPKLASIIEGQPIHPTRNVVEGNVVSRHIPISLKRGAVANDTERNFITSEELEFVDASKMNFNLKPTSKVFQALPGFQPLPFDQMGLFQDLYRR